ncbi:MAG: sarcosine oxidase subunit alpha family protein [Rhizobiaceae bacterium]
MPAQPYRLAAGGLVDRERKFAFTFDGRPMKGLAGDTLASALMGNGVRLVGRSFKYHRPRGILTAGPEEPNALVELRRGPRREPNTKATTVELFEGLEASSQNRWPSLSMDMMAVNSLLSKFFVAGFYYKTFMWPASLWERLYEPLIRRAAGLGRASGVADPDVYEKAWAHCDVLVVGAGPAGIAAALAAGRAGARVILAEQDFIVGGRPHDDDGEIDGMPAHAWVSNAMGELGALPNVRIMVRTAVFGVYDGGTYGALQRTGDHLARPEDHRPRQVLWRVVARRCVLASGATERPIAFGGNDRPGVMLASAVRTYVRRFAAAPGKRIALFMNNDDGWKTVACARRAGLEVTAVIDPRDSSARHPRSSAEPVDFPVHRGVVTDVRGGRGGIHGIVATLANGRRVEVQADTLAVSGGWNPNLGLATHHGAGPRWREDIAAFVPDVRPRGMSAVGAADGAFSLDDCLSSGHEAGRVAASECGHATGPGEVPTATAERVAITPLWHVEGKQKAFVDLQHDVTTQDIELSHREGFASVEHLKRYTTLGMATDQGATSNVVGLALLASLTRRSISETGVTRHRPPQVPVAIGALAGPHRGEDFRPTRLTPSHAWAKERGAVFVDIGQWKRAQWYPLPGERDWLASVDREVLNVRNGVGFCDVSTLGKIDVMGPDAGTFLDRVYVNGFSSLAVGRARYGLMLREDGIAMDDGTTSRLAEDQYFLTTTTAKAGPVMQHLEFCRQVLWPELDVQLASCSDQWAQFSIAGPRTRDLLGAIVESSEDLSDGGFPFMGVRAVRLRGNMEARLFRISFSGELAFEIAVPTRFGDALVRNLMVAGRPFGIAPYGTEALGAMRIEKGHVAGPELNGTTTAGDLGLGRMLSRKKDFIGRSMAAREALVAPDRSVLVGLKPIDRASRLRAGAHLLARGEPVGQRADQGYVTSVCHSPSFGQWLGLGLVARGRERHGELLRAYDPLRGGDFDVEICNPVFYDPEGVRQRG